MAAGAAGTVAAETNSAGVPHEVMTLCSVDSVAQTVNSQQAGYENAAELKRVHLDPVFFYYYYLYIKQKMSSPLMLAVARS